MYIYPPNTEKIAQGDIFFDLPLPHLIDFDKLNLLGDEGDTSELTWDQARDKNVIHAILPVEKVQGIVLSQDCDNLRNQSISFCLIGDLEEISGKKLPEGPDSETKRKKFRAHIWDAPAISGYKWFYLQEDSDIGFDKKMAVDFEVVFQVPRESLERNIPTLRKGRLNSEAIEHFRKSMANYFTRYAYNKWYSLTPEEFEAYNSTLPEDDKAEPYPYQKKKEE